jgi:hypothetical protein
MRITDPGDLAATLASNHTIGLHGLQTKADYRTPATKKAFEAGREKLATYETDFEAACQWLSSRAPRRTPNKKISSAKLHDLLACPQGVIVAACEFMGRGFKRLRRDDNTVLLCVD